jgi:hypothetical protein
MNNAKPSVADVAGSSSDSKNRRRWEITLGSKRDGNNKRKDQKSPSH